MPPDVPTPPPVLGWHEAVSLPEFGIELAFAKLDTGADQSVLHATHVRLAQEDRLEFSLPLLLVQRSCGNFTQGGPRRVSALVVDERWVKSSNGAEEVRYVIETSLLLSGQQFRTRFSLTDRTGMRFSVLLGRSALRDRFLIDSGQAHLAGPSTATDSACSESE